MPVIEKLYLDEVELILEDLPENVTIIITKAVSDDGEELFNVEIEDEDLFDELREKLENE